MNSKLLNLKSLILYLALAMIIIVLDQISKLWVVEHLTLHQSISVWPVFSIARVHNYGAAFGFLNNAGGWQTLFFTLVAVTVSVIIVIWLSRIASQQRQLSLALSLVLGGALGNLIDRVNYHYVVDFLFFYYQSWQFPAFNIADIAISIGAMFLLADSFGYKIISDSQNKHDA